MPHDEFDRGVIRKRGPGIHETWVLYHRTRPRWTGEVHEKVHRVDGDNFSTWTCERVEIDVISQDLYHEQSGAYTGEISADMLLSIGVKTSIVGHSERRKYFNESDIILSKKVNSAIQNSMNVI